MIVFSLGRDALAAEIAALSGGVIGRLEARRFPDGESYVRLDTNVEGATVIIVCNLADPDTKFLPLYFTASAARASGATEVVLVAPYLPYLRQDMAFRPGEAVTSRHFARLVSSALDRVITVDPHLHRYSDLSEIYTAVTCLVHAAPLLATWISEHVEHPVLVGPDEESEQWVREVAALAKAPHFVCRKERRGDWDVRLTLPDTSQWTGLRPVLLDDIISSGATMIEACALLAQARFDRPTCLAVHALFGTETAGRLSEVAAEVATTDTVPHPSNAFSVAALLADALTQQR